MDKDKLCVGYLTGAISGRIPSNQDRKIQRIRNKKLDIPIVHTKKFIRSFNINAHYSTLSVEIKLPL